VGEIACVAPSIGRWAAKRLEKNLVCGVGVRAAWEQAPIAANQIRLGSMLDSAGIPRPELHYRKTELELRTVRETFTLFGKYLIDKNLGRARFLPWVLGRGDYPADDEQGGYHHLGGTRMSADPRKGVVDADCKVHDVNNLYIGGSSVFPSGGQANPTFTIVQLALRLADRLHYLISGKVA
jgi:choline dehydrogenase-like flavoprotein